MNTQTQEALKMAIEDAMKFVNTLNGYEDANQSKPFKTEADKYLSYASVVIKSLATSLQEALEQPAQEPVAKLIKQPFSDTYQVKSPPAIQWLNGVIPPVDTLLYTHPAPSEPFIGGSVCPSCGNHSLFKTDKSEWCVTHKCLWQSDYPPSWQGLSDDEIRSLDLDNDVISVIFQTEKLLKEKNYG